MKDLNKKIEQQRAEMHNIYCSEAVDSEVMAQTEIGLAFIKIEDYMSMLEKKINLLEMEL